MSKRIGAAVAALAGAAFLASTAHAQAPFTVFSDNFNAETANLGVTSLTNWNVTRNTVDVIGGGTSNDFYPGNGLYLDLAGTPGLAKIVTKNTFTLGPGNYTLSFLLGQNNNGASSVNVGVGSAFSETFSTQGSVPTFIAVNRTFTVGASSLATISFDQLTASNDLQGNVIDNVQLRYNGIPEPATLALLGLVPLGLVVLRRRNGR